MPPKLIPKTQLYTITLQASFYPHNLFWLELIPLTKRILDLFCQVLYTRLICITPLIHKLLCHRKFTFPAIESSHFLPQRVWLSVYKHIIFNALCFFHFWLFLPLFNLCQSFVESNYTMKIDMAKSWDETLVLKQNKFEFLYWFFYNESNFLLNLLN